MQSSTSGIAASSCFSLAAASADWRSRTCSSRDNLLAASTQPDACSAAATGVNPFAPKPAHHKAARHGRDLAVHGRRLEPDGHVRSQAGAQRSTPAQPIDGKVRGDVIVRQGFPGPLMPSPFSFKKYGQSGIEVSEIFPHLAEHVDEIAFLRSVFGRSNDHVQGTYEMQTGQINLGFPSVGSWVTYGLGSVASSLPAYVVMTDARGGPLGGPNDWSAGFMPAAYQGTLFRSTGDPIVDLKPPAGMSAEDQRARLDALAKLNELDMQKFPGQQRAGGAHLVVRAGLPDAGLRARGRRSQQRIGGDEEALRTRQTGSPSRTDGNA